MVSLLPLPPLYIYPKRGCNIICPLRFVPSLSFLQHRFWLKLLGKSRCPKAFSDWTRARRINPCVLPGWIPRSIGKQGLCQESYSFGLKNPPPKYIGIFQKTCWIIIRCKNVLKYAEVRKLLCNSLWKYPTAGHPTLLNFVLGVSPSLFLDIWNSFHSMVPTGPGGRLAMLACFSVWQARCACDLLQTLYPLLKQHSGPQYRDTRTWDFGKLRAPGQKAVWLFVKEMEDPLARSLLLLLSKVGY